MRNINILGCITLIILLLSTGCAPVLKVSKEFQRSPNDSFVYSVKSSVTIEVPEETISKLKSHLDAALAKRNILATDGAVDSKQIEITIVNYNMRSDGARFWGGIFAGTDIIDTQVLVKSNGSTDTLGEFTVVSKNESAWGTSDGLIQGHADKIVQYLSDGKKE